MVTVRPTSEEDAPELDRLFRARFGHPFSLEAWRWKYRLLPGEARSLVAIDEQGRLLAHAGSTAVPARWRGREGLLWQGVDFVSGNGGGRPGLAPPILAVGRRLLGDLPRPGDLPWNYGFPSGRHQRLGEHRLGYRQAGWIRVWEGALPAGAAAGVCWSEVAGEWCRQAWEACGAPGTVRSVAYLDWRYRARPGRHYRFYRLPGAGIDGLVVAAFVGAEAWLAEIWLPSGVRWRPALAAVGADLAAAGLTHWKTWPPAAACGGEELLADLGLAPNGDRFLICCRGFAGTDRRHEAAELCYLMGDYDVV